MSGDFAAYSMGLIYASVCTSLSDDDATDRLNAEHPAGTVGGWTIASDPTFAAGEPNPCPCNRRPETHRHILFSC
jgi:hypothetical protein